MFRHFFENAPYFYSNIGMFQENAGAFAERAEYALHDVLEQFGDCFLEYRMDGFPCYFGQRGHDESPLRHQRMRKRQFGQIQHEVVIKEQVDVDEAIGINALYGLLFASHFLFDCLGEVQYVQRRKGCFHTCRRIQETVFRPESPRGCFVKRGKGSHLPYPFRYHSDGAEQVFPFVAQIGA